MTQADSIKRYETMAMLELSGEESERLAGCFAEITGGFAALEHIDTNNTAPLVTVLELCNILREDTAEKQLTRDELLANAPERYDGFFQVPETMR